MMFLFPDQNPPALPNGANVDQACTWLLAVMDEGDRTRKFVSSVLAYYLDRGYVTERQMDSLRDVTSKAIRRYIERDLQSQGSAPAADQTLDFGNVIEFQHPFNGRVSE